MKRNMTNKCERPEATTMTIISCFVWAGGKPPGVTAILDLSIIYLANPLRAFLLPTPLALEQRHGFLCACIYMCVTIWAYV